MKLLDIVREEVEDKQDYLIKQRKKVRHIHSALKRGKITIDNIQYKYVLGNDFDVNVIYCNGYEETEVRFKEEMLTPKYRDKILKLYKVNPDGEEEYVPYGHTMKSYKEYYHAMKYDNPTYESAWDIIKGKFKNFTIRIYPFNVTQTNLHL